MGMQEDGLARNGEQRVRMQEKMTCGGYAGCFLRLTGRASLDMTPATLKKAFKVELS